MRKPHRQSRAFILIAPDFEEEPVVHCLSQWREAGVSASLVGLSAQPVGSAHGLVVRPDVSLERSLTAPSPQLVLIAGGTACASALLADPRVHRVLGATLNAGGAVAVAYTAQAAVAGAGLSPPHMSGAIIRQDDLSSQEFAEQLISRLANDG